LDVVLIGSPMLSEMPLSEMLSQLLVAYTIEFDNEFERFMPHRTAFGDGGPEQFVSQSGEPLKRPGLTSIAMWSNFMRYVPPEGIPLDRLAGMPANRAGLERWGYIFVSPERLIKPTRAGRFAQAGWRQLDGVVDQRWAERFGADVIADLTESLREIAGQVGAGMPRYLPMVGFADGMRTKYRDLRETGLPVAEAAELDLSALLSQVLLAFTLEYESTAKLPLPISANILRVIGDDGVRASDIPLRAGVSREGVASSLGFLERRGYIEVGHDPSGRRGKYASPTPRGVRTRDGRPKLAARIEQAWPDRFGAAQTQALRTSMEHLLSARTSEGEPTLAAGLHPHQGGWRSRNPYLAQTEAVLSDPAAHLPRHPMVLHRGGYPDGS
jgi:DNA-binding MarR family transcriptional regulator